MNAEKQRIAIAEACGWTAHNHPDNIQRFESWASKSRWWVDPSGMEQFAHNIPDYLNDLNAMHEVERTLTPKQWIVYVVNLNNGFTTFDIEDVGGRVFTPAHQRAEAFLRTVSKWEDEP